MNLLTEIKNDATGAALLADWLGEGGETVDQATAEARAAVCLQCPMHRPGKWWEIVFKDPMAHWIRTRLAIKHRLGLRLSVEDKMGMCSVCGCALRLKAWTPTKFIAAHTSPEKLSEYPKTGCWIRSEIERKTPCQTGAQAN